MNRRHTLVTTLVILAVTVALDQITKIWAESALEDGDVIEIVPTLEFDLAYNSGFSFSTGSGFGQYIGVLVFGLIGFLVWQIAVSETMPRVWILATIMGGAIGNLVDRLFRADDGFLSGEVIDFIDVTWYAVFNIADMFVVGGAVAFAAYELRMHKLAERAATAEAESANDHDPGSGTVLTNVSEDNTP